MNITRRKRLHLHHYRHYLLALLIGLLLLGLHESITQDQQSSCQGDDDIVCAYPATADLGMLSTFR